MAGRGAAKLVIQHNGSFRRPDSRRKARRALLDTPGRVSGSAQHVLVTLRHAGPPISGHVAQSLAD